MRVPMKKFKQIYHVGALTAQPAACSRSSLEGHCLSVSEVPNAWRAIAQLGNDPLWQLRKADNQFLDVYRMSKKLHKAIEQWGLAEGYIEQRMGWITELDSEDGEGSFAHSATHEEAVMHWGEDDDECIANRYSRLMVFSTDKLEAYARQKIELSLVTDMLILAYAELVLGIDGVFWNENLDVYALSAPRAGIFPSKLNTWSITQTAHAANEKEEY